MSTLPQQPVHQQPLEPPHAVEVEQVILGACMARPRQMAEFAAMLRPEHFHDPLHQTIFDVILSRYQAGEPFWPEFVMRDLRNDPRFSKDPRAAMDGGLPLVYIARLANAVTSSIAPSDPAALAEVVLDAAHRRALMGFTDELKADLQANVSLDAKTIADRAQAYIDGVGEGFAGDVRREGSIKDAVTAYATATTPPRVSTGLAGLDAIIGGFERGTSTIVAGRPSMGKAQPLDAGVCMADGSWRRMGDLRFGDEIASVDGRPSRVIGVFPQGRRPVFRVTLSDGRATRCCGDHLWSVTSSKWGGDARVLSTEELRQKIATERYRRRIRVPIITDDAVADADLPVDPWLLGVLIGNGSLTRGSLSVSVADAATLYRVQSLLGDTVSAKASGDYDYRLSSPRGAENWLISAIEGLGLRGHRSEDKFIPAVYMAGSRRQRLALLQGLMDTDGWVESFGAMRYSTSSQRLASQVADLVRSLGGVCSIATKAPHYMAADGVRRAGLPHYVLNIRHPQPRSLVTLKRKARRLPEARDVPLTIASIEPDGEEDVRCIAVSHPSRLYVTDGYTVTHNSALGLFCAYTAARRGENVVFVSTEMTRIQVGFRLVSMYLAEHNIKVEYEVIRKKGDRLREWNDVVEALDQIQQMPLHFVQGNGLPIESIRADVMRHRTRCAVMSKKLDLVVVDYLQSIEWSKGHREVIPAVNHISRSLKNMAAQLDVPVVTMAQLSRAVEQRQDKRPILSDLRESGAIEQDADVIMFMYREYYYRRNEPPLANPAAEADRLATLVELKHKAECIVAKNRDGRVENVHLGCDMGLNTFWDMGERSVEEGLL